MTLETLMYTFVGVVYACIGLTCWAMWRLWK